MCIPLVHVTVIPYMYLQNRYTSLWFMLPSFPTCTYRRDVHPFETDTKGRLFIVDVSINWATDRHWQTKLLDTWKVPQLTDTGRPKYLIHGR